MNLPGYSPDFNADEAIWGWVREEGTGNLCLGIREAVQEMVGGFLSGLANRKDGVKQRCRTVLQSRAEAHLRNSRPDSQRPANAHPTLALVWYCAAGPNRARVPSWCTSPTPAVPNHLHGHRHRPGNPAHVPG